MLRPRVIPCLLVHDKGLVKTVRFAEPKYVGDPINAVRIFNEKGVDELIVLDIDATVRGQEPDYRMIENFAAESRMPLCYGGGVKTTDQAKRIIGLGVEKVAISSAAIADGTLIRQVSEAVGSQSVVVVLDAKAHRMGDYEVWTHNGRVRTGRSLTKVAAEMEREGAGEIVVNSITNDGMMKGYDLAMVRQVRDVIQLPLTVLGGAGHLKDIAELIAQFGVLGAAAGSLFVFKGVYRAVLINYPDSDERERMFSQCLPLS
jgi:cyclase